MAIKYYGLRTVWILLRIIMYITCIINDRFDLKIETTMDYSLLKNIYYSSIKIVIKTHWLFNY